MAEHVFVYGSLKANYWNNRCLGDSLQLAEGRTVDTYHMTEGGFPFIRRQEAGLPVRGEVYVVEDDNVMHRLDVLEGNGHFYDRVQRDIYLDSGEIITAWVYENDRYEGNKESPQVEINDVLVYEWSN